MAAAASYSQSRLLPRSEASSLIVEVTENCFLMQAAAVNFVLWSNILFSVILQYIWSRALGVRNSPQINAGTKDASISSSESPSAAPSKSH